VAAVAPREEARAATRQMALGLSSWPGDDLANLDRETALYGRAPATWTIWADWSSTPNFPTAVANGVRDRGAVPFIWWAPNNGTSGDFAWTDITNGTYDSYMRQWAQDAKAYGGNVIVRFAQEMDGAWFKYGNTRAGNTAAGFVDAWRHMWNVFRGPGGVGADNVKFMWSPYTPAAAWYPGDAYTDYVGFSAFNWGSSKNQAWRGMKNALSYGVSQSMKITSKPIIVAETASTPVGGDKAAWVTNGYNNSYAAYPTIKEIVYFDVDMSPSGQPDWRLVTPAAAADAYRAVLTDARFQGSIEGSGSVAPPPPPPPPPAGGTPIIADSFSRSTASGFGTAATGGAYATNTSDFSVNGSQGNVSVRAGISASALLNSASARDVDLGVSFSVSALPQGTGSVYFYVVARRTSAGDEYRIKSQIDTSGRIRFGVSKVVGGMETDIAPVATVGGLTESPGKWIRIRATASGTSPTTWQVKAWDASGAEPGAWPITVTDGTASLQAPGTQGLRVYSTKTLTNTPLTMLMDDYNVADTGSGTTPPPPTTTFASDDFSRSVASGLGSAPTGGAYTVNNPGAFSVNGSAAVVSITAGGTRDADLKAATLREVDMSVAVTLRALPTGTGSLYVYAVTRRQSLGNEYRARIRIDTAGAVRIALSRVVGKTETSLGSEVLVPGVTATPGLAIHLRVRATGSGTTTLSARAWTGATEPGSWQVTATDTTAALQVTGSVGFVSYLSGGVTNGPIVFEVDELVASQAN